MFYKVIKDDKIIDVLDRLVYLKYQEKHNRMIFCDINEAQAIISSDEKHIWHTEGLYKIPVDGYETVEILPIDRFEYEQLRMFGMKSIEEVLDAYTLLLIQEEVI